MDFETYLNTPVAKRAVERDFEIIGEALNRIKYTDDPRGCEKEREIKKDIIEKIENGQITEEQWAYEYDLEIKF